MHRHRSRPEHLRDIRRDDVALELPNVRARKVYRLWSGLKTKPKAEDLASHLTLSFLLNDFCIRNNFCVSCYRAFP